MASFRFRPRRSSGMQSPAVPKAPLGKLTYRSVPTSTRARVAVSSLVGSLLIPVSTTTLHGQQHLVSCVDEIDQIFAVAAVDANRATIIGSTEIVRDAPAGDCASVEMEMSVKADGRGFVRIEFPVSNPTDRAWSTSVTLVLDGVTASVPIGRVAPGAVVTKEVRVRLTEALENITGTLVVGP